MKNLVCHVALQRAGPRKLQTLIAGSTCNVFCVCLTPLQPKFSPRP